MRSRPPTDPPPPVRPCCGSSPGVGAAVVPIAWVLACCGACAPGSDAPPADGLVFADGTVVSNVRVAPDPARPGEPITVTWTHAVGSSRRLDVRLVPPRVGGRQEVRRRVGRAPLVEDPRSQVQTLDAASGEMSVSFDLPADWGSRSGVVLVAPWAGQTRSDATSGPRRDDGWGVLAAIPVASRPTDVRALRVEDGAIRVDGELSEPVWGGPGQSLVASSTGEPVPDVPTKVWFAWDARALYLAGELRDRDIWATYTEQDDPLYKQEVFELFVAADDSATEYIEYEVSPRNVTFDAHFPRYRKGDEAWDSRWETAVSVDGTLDNRKDRDKGWTVEVAVPWTELCERTRITCPPGPGTTFRVNVFRIEMPRRGAARGLSLSPTHAPDFHAWANAARLELAP